MSQQTMLIHSMPVKSGIFFLKGKKIATLILVAFHLFLIVLINVESTYTSYHEFYFKREKKKPFFTILHSINSSGALSYYTEFSGIESGYGFFAPNVASEFILKFTEKKTNGDIIKISYSPSFKSKESYVRYSSALSIFLDKLNSDTTKVDTDNASISDAVLLSVAKKLLDVDNVPLIEVELYLYDFPNLKSYRKGDKSPKLIFIKKIELNALGFTWNKRTDISR